MAEFQQRHDQFWRALETPSLRDLLKNLHLLRSERGDATVERKLSIAREKFAPYPQTEKPLVYYDYTNECGFIVTDAALYGRPSYLLFKSKNVRIALGDIRTIEYSDNKLIVNGNHVADLYMRARDNPASIFDRIVIEEYFKRLLSWPNAISDSQLRAYVQPDKAGQVVREIAAAGATKLVLYRVLLSQKPAEVIVLRSGSLIVTNHRIVRLPDEHQLRGKNETFVVGESHDQPELIHHTPHFHNPVVNMGLKIAKNIHNKEAIRNHEPKVISYHGQVTGAEPDPIYPTFSSFSAISFSWKPSEKTEVEALAKKLSDLGISIVSYAESLNLPSATQ